MSDSQTIFRYEVGVADQVTLPEGATLVLHVARARDYGPGGMTSGRLEVWCEAFPGFATRAPKVVLSVFGTGHPLVPGRGRHVGTVLDGAAVWHVYASGEVESIDA
jgi:hypothetical protein